jgi:molybdate transport system substrate-binding protein
MLMRISAAAIAGLALSLISTQSFAGEQLTVMASGGFSQAYREVLPDFERATGISVTTLSGSSQGDGPKTIKAQLQNGVAADVVILSREGLQELTALNLILDGSDAGLADAALGAAVHEGSPKPNISNIDNFKQTLLHTKLVVMPGSTSGLFMKNDVFPKLGIADKVATRIVARGSESTAMVAAGDAQLAIGPISELVNQPGVAVVGPLPDEVQLVQTFTAAITKASHHQTEARQLIQFLKSDRVFAAIERAGMTPAK